MVNFGVQNNYKFYVFLPLTEKNYSFATKYNKL